MSVSCCSLSFVYKEKRIKEEYETLFWYSRQNLISAALCRWVQWSAAQAVTRREPENSLKLRQLRRHAVRAKNAVTDDRHQSLNGSAVTNSARKRVDICEANCNAVLQTGPIVQRSARLPTDPQQKPADRFPVGPALLQRRGLISISADTSDLSTSQLDLLRQRNPVKCGSGENPTTA